MITAGIIIAMVLVVFGWFALRDRIAEEGLQAAETCVEGDRSLPVAVDPAITPQITELASRFDATSPVVRDHCVTVEVSTVNSDSVVTALTSADERWDADTLGARPALWIPRSSGAMIGLPPGTISGTQNSIASSPIVLAAPADVTAALSAANVGWADLPELQLNPDALGSIGLPGWGGLRLQFPTAADTEISTSVLSAIVSASLETPDTPNTLEQLREQQAASALSSLSVTDQGRPSVVPDTAGALLTQLSADVSPTGAVHVVPVAEQQLVNSAAGSLSTYTPSGAAPVVDYPATVLSGSWTDDTLSRAAAQFVEFIKKPENSSVFTDAGFDGPVAAGAASSSAPDVQNALLDAVRDPATARRTTVLVDVSESMDADEAGRTRLQNIGAALTVQFDSVIDSTALGLWEYSKDLDGPQPFRKLVSTGPMDEQLTGGSRREELAAAATALTSKSASSTYASVTAAYGDAVENYEPGKPNSLLLVTDGPNDDASISAEKFLKALSELTDPAKPVAVEVVNIGTNSDIDTIQSMADATGGSVTTVDSAEGPEFPDLLRTLLY